MRLKWNSVTFAWVAFVALFVYAGYRERNTFPLRWSGYPAAIHPAVKIAVAIAVVGVFIFVWASHRK